MHNISRRVGEKKNAGSLGRFVQQKVIKRTTTITCCRPQSYCPVPWTTRSRIREHESVRAGRRLYRKAYEYVLCYVRTEYIEIDACGS